MTDDTLDRECLRCGAYGYGCYECTPDPTDREIVERLAAILEHDADEQNWQPCEMTGLLPDDEHEAAGTLRALLAAKEKAEAERDDLLDNNHLKADAINRWTNTSAAQHQEIEELKAERDALRDKLEVAKQSLSNSRETHCGLAEYIFQGGTNTKGIFADSQRARLAIDATLRALDQPKG